MYSGIKKTITEISEDFPLDLIHAHTGLADGHVGMLLAKYYNIPLITTIRSMDIYHEMNRNKISYNILKNILQYSAQVITLSPASKQKLIAEFNQPSLIIPNGIYTEQSLDIVNIPSTIHDQYRNKRILVSVSDLIERKRIDLNIHAVAKLRQNYPDILYLIIGEGEHRITLEKLVEELECTKHVRFLGEVPHSQVFKYMKAANIFTLPSYDETFGLVYLEAMLCGTPVIGTKNEGIDGVIHHKQTGMLVESGNIVELEEAIQYLIDNPEKADRMGEAGRLLVVNNYSWSQIADRLRQVYFNTKKLLGD